MDNLTIEKRSWNMSRIRGRNTKPEIRVRSLLHRMGFRFRLKNDKLPGKPDIILSKYKTTIFIHGCFWHRHMNCKNNYTPKSRTDFWMNKFNANIKRDKQISENISNIGWNQLIIWECETNNEEQLTKKIKDFLFGT
ncbi:MAG: DNA mismatch endonuclease Vsr [Verrucomicrobia bacterium]|nr:DNA mismatch endonuclease Vsr [Verrucomicrobiota bacterium]